MPDGHHEAVRRRAGYLCEYCRMPESMSDTPFQIDHIIARQHRGKTAFSNLALACLHCNGHKGPNLTGIDPLTRKLTRLFDPRRHKWERHFCWRGSLLQGMTPVGRTTIVVLDLNGPEILEFRRELMDEGKYFEK